MAGNKQQVIDLEKRFWQSIKDKEVATARSMIAEESLVTGPFGTMRVDPAKFAEMMEKAPWTLERFEFSDVDVIFPSEAVAVITYKVHQTGEMENRPMDMVAANSTVWTGEGKDWKVALHTETILKDSKERQHEPA